MENKQNINEALKILNKQAIIYSIEDLNKKINNNEMSGIHKILDNLFILCKLFKI